MVWKILWRALCRLEWSVTTGCCWCAFALASPIVARLAFKLFSVRLTGNRRVTDCQEVVSAVLAFSWDSHVVTHHTTNQPACGLSTAERTGSPVFHTLWSYVPGLSGLKNISLGIGFKASNPTWKADALNLVPATAQKEQNRNPNVKLGTGNTQRPSHVQHKGYRLLQRRSGICEEHELTARNRKKQEYTGCGCIGCMSIHHALNFALKRRYSSGGIRHWTMLTRRDGEGSVREAFLAG
ncbi:predicted protein [Aspergillus nidulans FGSC A4]|uniref:Uncharacterized protein n=1 Tax=Emericella nidulans (strain FGSC A4 / ATCC 38163 / CBS 112.46 / NRRL 194 / M139) TaxID=227321 RepID=Q5AVZ9_EMENI|nr:hypothetical protein [Aspergillus nidulans FGSC A4]EAA62111.1 predicted protein [Aspergillus nidulans FGSC A4]CBF79577.1 TPA: conserved hypothetical protein [Aspergillus nidulans FGSC A4]|eukprot:XP_680800.1 predicted protein [Aspergillus nidulans FGSC A4]